jgi:hypothetical protein
MAILPVDHLQSNPMLQIGRLSWLLLWVGNLGRTMMPATHQSKPVIVEESNLHHDIERSGRR